MKKSTFLIPLVILIFLISGCDSNHSTPQQETTDSTGQALQETQDSLSNTNYGQDTTPEQVSAALPGEDEKHKKGGVTINLREPTPEEKAQKEAALKNASKDDLRFKILYSGTGPKGPDDPAAEALFSSGAKKAKAGDYPGAIEDFSKSLQLVKNANTYLKRGYANYLLKNYREAIKDYTSAIRLVDSYEMAFYLRAMAKYDLNDYWGMIPDLDTVLELKHRNPEAFNYRAAAKYLLRDMKGALEDYSQVIVFNPDYKDVYNNRGIVKFQLDDLAGAIADYTEQIKRTPNHAAAYNNRGAARLRQKEYKAAIEDFNQAVALKDGYGEAYDNRGLARYSLHDQDGACKDWQRALSLGFTKSAEKLNKYCGK